MGIRFALCWLAVVVTLAPQESILIEKARRGGGKASNELKVSQPICTLEELVARSTIVLQGRIQSVSTRLLENGDYVVTEWTVVPIRIYKGQLQPLKTPGPSRTVVVRRLGGTTVVDGLQLTTKVTGDPEAESLRPGEDAVLFLVRSDTRPDAFSIWCGPFGVFRVREGRISAMTKTAAERRGDALDVDFAAFEASLSRLIGINAK